MKMASLLISFFLLSAFQDKVVHFDIVPAVAGPDSELAITLSDRMKNAEIIVVTPDDKRVELRMWDYLSPSLNGLGDFRHAKLKLSNLSGRLIDDGAVEDFTLFTAEGCYLFYVADNTETEPDNTLWFEKEVCYSKSDTRDFNLSPSQLNANSKLTFSFSEYFKKAEIAVTTPSNKRVYLRLRDWAAPPFTELGYFTEAELKVSQVTGRIWKDGVSTDVKLFSEEGCYLFTAADILETEPENAQWFKETVCYSKN